MALTGLSPQTEFLPTVRFNAREGIFSRADRVMDSAGNYSNELTDITAELAEQGVLIDVANIEIGWIRFEGGVDITTQHHSLGLPGSRPSDWHKEGVKLELWLPQDIAEGAPLREWTHTSKAVINSVNDLHTAWESAVAADRLSTPAVDGATPAIDDSQVPHVMVSIEAVKTKHGTFKKPVLTLKQFVARPIDWTITPIVAAAPSVPDTAPQMADAGAFGSAAPPASAAKDDDLPF